MADANITKKALASAMKELMQEKPFSKISINDICSRCDMNRKSFYYHFQDKYDLVNWIFDVEFVAIAKSNCYTDTWEAFADLFAYFYANRNFYRKALSISGQNSLLEHFRELLQPFIARRLAEELEIENITQRKKEFCSCFLSDAFISAIERWLLDKECMPADEFLSMLRFIIAGIGKLEFNGDNAS